MSQYKLYKIMLLGPKHFQHEAIVDGKPSGKAYYGPRFSTKADGRAVESVSTALVGYAAEGTGKGFKSEILLTKEEYEKLRHMKLVPILAQNIVQTGDGVGELKKKEPLEVPDDWQDLPDDQRLLLASQIAEKNVTSKQTADRIISGYLAKINKAKQG